MPIVAIIIWIILLGMVAFVFIMKFVGKKKYQGVPMDITEGWYENSQEKYPNDPCTHRYFFHHDKSFVASGHVLEDINHKIVYEAKFLYNNVTSADEVDFINHLIDYKHHHKVGHAVSHEVGINDFSTTTTSSFSFDGEDVYEYLNKLGYDYKFKVQGLAYTIDIYKNGEKVATIYSSNNGKNLYEADGPIVAKMGGKGINILECRYEDLDATFLYAMVFARTELSDANLVN